MKQIILGKGNILISTTPNSLIFRQLKNSYQLKVFEFQNVKFDFTQYSRDSVDVLLDQINWVEKFIPKSIAC